MAAISAAILEFTYIYFFFQWICTTVAVLLHYLYTASFTWMCAEGLHLYFKIVTAFNLHRIKMIYYVILGWGKYYKRRLY